MKKAFGYFYYLFLKFALSLRYRIKVEGLEELKKHSFEKKGGLLFLANHPAEIDPAILLSLLWPNFKPHPVAIDYLFQNPFIRYLLEFVGSFVVPQFEQGMNSYKKKRMDQTYENIYQALRNGENILIYPSGGLKKQAEDIIGGTSGIQTIVQNCPEANIVMISIRGLWGSSFSRALSGSSPNIMKAISDGMKTVLKNLIFFSPRRDVSIKIEVPHDFPKLGTRLEINRYVENFFNKEGPEPLKLVPYSIWNRKLPKAFENNKIKEEVDLSEIPQDTVIRVKEEIATLSGRAVSDIKESQYLAKDLGLDSLDVSQLILFLKESFGINNIPITDLAKVEDLIAFAAGLRKGKTVNDEPEKKPERNWEHENKRPDATPPRGDTILEAFFNVTDRMNGYVAAADLLTGEVSYKRFKLAAFIIAEALKKIPGDKIGIMMPSSVTVNIIIMAALMAKKVPVMINWTLGKRNLQSVIQDSEVQNTISSWKFLNRLDNVDLNGIDDQIILIEDIARNFTLKDKIKAQFLSLLSTKKLHKIYRADPDDTAVILFTSGTENVPKGVPLSHRNIITNQKDVFEKVAIIEDDVLFCVLPPFHSFGFSIAGLFPILCGLKALYFANPTDGRQMSALLEKWNVTLFCIVPTFLKNILRVASEKQMKHLRFIVTGAEKTPSDVYEKMKALNSQTILGEGYGITECGPVLTLNPFNAKKKGVGVALKHVELLIVDPETHSRLDINKEGLILARGTNIFKGYLNPKLASPFMEVEGKEWYNTGDLGHLDEEGYLTISGRLKRFVKVGGEMISLASIEDVLYQAASTKGWKVDSDKPSMGVCAKEEEGKKGEIHLFTTFPLKADAANDALKEAGMSNLIKITTVHQLPFIPLLGTGKIDYKSLIQKI